MLSLLSIVQPHCPWPLFVLGVVVFRIYVPPFCIFFSLSVDFVLLV